MEIIKVYKGSHKVNGLIGLLYVRANDDDQYSNNPRWSLITTLVARSIRLADVNNDVAYP